MLVGPTARIAAMMATCLPGLGMFLWVCVGVCVYGSGQLGQLVQLGPLWQLGQLAANQATEELFWKDTRPARNGPGRQLRCAERYLFEYNSKLRTFVLSLPVPDLIFHRL